MFACRSIVFVASATEAREDDMPQEEDPDSRIKYSAFRHLLPAGDKGKVIRFVWALFSERWKEGGIVASHDIFVNSWTFNERMDRFSVDDSLHFDLIKILKELFHEMYCHRRQFIIKFSEILINCIKTVIVVKLKFGR